MLWHRLVHSGLHSGTKQSVGLMQVAADKLLLWDRSLDGLTGGPFCLIYATWLTSLNHACTGSWEFDAMTCLLLHHVRHQRCLRQVSCLGVVSPVALGLCSLQLQPEMHETEVRPKCCQNAPMGPAPRMATDLPGITLPHRQGLLIRPRKHSNETPR